MRVVAITDSDLFTKRELLDKVEAVVNGVEYPQFVYLSKQDFLKLRANLYLAAHRFRLNTAETDNMLKKETGELNLYSLDFTLRPGLVIVDDCAIQKAVKQEAVEGKTSAEQAVAQLEVWKKYLKLNPFKRRRHESP